ncbi:MAG: fasciclin domain-containing protein [Caulobacteraceae bacterium]
MRSHSRLLAAAIALLASPVTTFAQNAPGAPSMAPAPPPAAPIAPAEAIPPSPHVVPNGDMITTLRSSGRFNILVKALDSTNLSPVLKSTPDLTLFAPTDQAFQALPPAELSLLLAPKNAPTLQKILTYHLVHLNLDSSKFKGAKGPVESVEKSPLQVDGSGQVLKVNNADIIQSDVHATNGTIQVIDKVLIPTDVQLPTTAAENIARPNAG